MERTILVTGGNRGIGFAVVRELAKRGHSLLLGARDLAAGKNAAESLRNNGLDASPVQLDLANVANINSAVSHISASGRSVDVLVNNAGVLHESPLLELSDAEITESIAVHLTGPHRLIRSLTPTMTEHGYGRIVNISSGWGSFAEGMGGPGAYGITKCSAQCTHRASRRRTTVSHQGKRHVPRLGANPHGRRGRNAITRGSGSHRCLACHASRQWSDWRLLS